MGAPLPGPLNDRRERPSWLRRAAWFLLPALLLHGIGLWALGRMLPMFATDHDAPAPASLVILQPPPEPEEEPEEEPLPELEGQIVELPPPEVEEEPEEADYVAEADVTVEEETRTDLFEVNPEVLSPEWAEEQKMEQEDLVDVNVDKPSTGAQVGNDRFDPNRDGNLASLPSPWAITNRDGVQDPVPSAHESAAVAGAPQNDLLDEKLGDRVALNAKEYLYASYINRIRRLVNFYWQQNIDNLPSSVTLVKSAYTTGVSVVLDSQGGLDTLEVVHESGSDPLDDCVVRAFKLAGPFPNPPEGLIEKDGRVYLPDMAFTVRQGQARMRYDGVDPRAGVQFPGLLKAPR